ncbi:MFS transporter [bacterium]|nr:MFS transporter [bacterium]
MSSSQRLYTATYFLSLAYNFLMAMSFTNNAVLPLYVKELGGTASTVGLFMGTAAVSAVVLRPLIGTALDRFGAKPVMMFGGLLIALPPLGYWATLSGGEMTWLVYLIRIVNGFGFGAHFSAFFTLAASTSPPDRRNEAIAMYGISGLAAHLVGPYLGELIFDTQGLPGFFLFITLFGVLGLITLLFIHPRVDEQAFAGKSASMTSSFKLLGSVNMRLPFVLSVLLSVCFSSAQFFIAPLARDRGIENFGLYFTFYAIAGISIRLLSRKWGDRFGVRRVMIPAFAFYGLGMGTIFLSQSTQVLMLAGIFSGLAHGVVFPAVNSLGYNVAPRGQAGSAVALLTGMGDLGSILTAFLFGAIAEQTSYGSAFLLASLGGFLAAGLGVASIVRRPEVIQTRRN